MRLLDQGFQLLKQACRYLSQTMANTKLVREMERHSKFQLSQDHGLEICFLISYHSVGVEWSLAIRSANSAGGARSSSKWKKSLITDVPADNSTWKSSPRLNTAGAMLFFLNASVASFTRLMVRGCEFMMLLPELTLTMHLGTSPSEQRYVFEPLFPETSRIPSEE